MKEKTLFLAWQDKRLTREWFPVGHLNISPHDRSYRFRASVGRSQLLGVETFEICFSWDTNFEPLQCFGKLQIPRAYRTH